MKREFSKEEYDNVDVAIGHCISCVSYNYINICIDGERCLKRQKLEQGIIKKGP